MNYEPKTGVTFHELRVANILRLPEFKNSHGAPAHSKTDGSDWSPAQWLQAMVGEVGEYANFRKKFDRGDITEAEFLVHAAKELADVQIYLDILAMQLGIDLGHAVQQKFNEVTRRVASNVFIHDQGVYKAKDEYDRQRQNYNTDPTPIHPCYD